MRQDFSGVGLAPPSVRLSASGEVTVTFMPENTRVYVGGLPYSASEDDVKAHFSAAGTVLSVFLPMDKVTGRKRGFGFVEFGTEAERDAAVAQFDQTDFGGRTIGVSPARPRD